MKYASEEQEGPEVEQTAGPAASAPEQTERRGTGVAPAPAPHDEQQGTRNRVARSILDHGPSTAAELALRLELTQAAVRRHLDALAAEGVVEPREKRVYGARGRGRPAKAFALTDCGRDAFDQAYDQLASDALRWIAQSAGGGEKGEAAVAAFARARLAAQAEGYRKAVESADPEARTEALAKALTADGYAATARSAPNPQLGEQLCQHHCPVAHVAEQYPQLCEAETEVFSRLLGTHVQRLATIAHGDGVCTTFIPKASAGKAAHSTARTSKTTTASASTAGRNPA
ncbi:helix-turn-helix transcriptional regulator [Streptomyces decoyicus]|uniref:helix-turn-helix transcriptional regulator n=1 Tax=Streptomyces decoyicus TaxID=249567 RepID=UPI0004AB7D61|nr:ArsR family transcriptional regulator [Streptomyces decoyicus]KOG37341.1 ArsR family transcriptional regulator [Streptomyces decoyicus]QZY15382.1 ArsR family transcriptional regulator [Streptomyces decoyicus]